MKHARILLITLQILLLVPYFQLDWSMWICFIPTFIIASWYLVYGLFIVSCKALIWLCQKYVTLKNDLETNKR